MLERMESEHQIGHIVDPESERSCCRCRCKLKTGAPEHRTHDNLISWRSRTWQMAVTCVILLMLPSIAVCESETPKNGTQSQPEGSLPDSKEARPIDKAMDPLYLMTNGFLDLLQPKDNGFILNEAKIIDDVTNGHYEVILISMENWQLWVKHYLGFVICAIFGVLFIVVMPIIGCFFCCCRCCGRCGAKGDMDEKKGDQCKRAVCGGLLGIFTFILLAGMVCGFVTNELMREQTTESEERAVLNTVSLELQTVDNFKANTINAFKTTVVSAIDQTATDVIGDIQNAAENAKNELGTVTDSVDVLDEALQLITATEVINRTLTTVKDSTALLVTDRNILLSNLSDVRQNLKQSLNGCIAPACVDLTNQVDALDAKADFTQVDDVTDELQKVQEVLNNNVANMISQGKTEFEDITKDVQQDIETELSNAQKEVEKIEETVITEIDKITKDLNQIQFNSTRKLLKSFQPQLEQYGDYRYYAGIGICCILLLIVLFCFLGLCFGICGESAGEDASTCNRGVGATILMVGVAFSFLFGWILMIIVLVIFLGGGLTYTEVCRYAVDLPNAPIPIKNTIDTFAAAQLDLNFDVKLTQVFENCQQNKGLYQSLNLSQVINLTDVLNVDNYGLKATIDDIVKNVNVDLSGVVIFSQSTRTELEKLRNSGLININFTTYQMQMDSSVVSPNLTQLALQVDSVARDLNTTDPTKASELQGYAHSLRTIESTTVAVMMSHMKPLAIAIPTLMVAVNGPPNLNVRVQNLVQALDKAQNAIQKNGTMLIKQFIRKTGDEIMAKLSRGTQELGKKIENDVGRCKPVATAVGNMIDAGCESVLGPFNGFWFSLGMCLFFLIPVIIISVHLVGVYRKTDEYYDGKSFDDVNYDAYAGVYPGDNIPLEDIHPRKNLRGPAAARSVPHGVHNAGYLPDDYPLGPAPREIGTRDYLPQPGGHPPISHPLGVAYPGGDYATPVSAAHPVNPPHYDYNSRPRMY